MMIGIRAAKDAHRKAGLRNTIGAKVQISGIVRGMNQELFAETWQGYGVHSPANSLILNEFPPFL